MMKDLCEGLRALKEYSFPKKCPNCGKVYHTLQDFLKETSSFTQKSGFKATKDNKGKTIIELFRNCPCGSTLMEDFKDRRDTSEQGIKRRKKFGELLEILVSAGMKRTTARAELLKVLYGKKSELLDKMCIKFK